MQLILTQPAQPITAVPGTAGSHIQVVPSSNVDVDTTLLVNTRAAKWLLSIRSSDGTKHFACEIFAAVFGSSVDYTMTSKLGHKFDVIIDVQFEATTMSLNITNLESYSLDVCFTRIQVMQ